MQTHNKIKREENNFDLLRIFAAFLVFFGHELLLTHAFSSEAAKFGVLISSLGANIFFIISGFLITHSWLSTIDIRKFFLKRIFRIFPALFVAILFSVFILGPSFSFLSLNNYFSDPQTYKYLNNLFIVQLLFVNENVLPGVFFTNTLPLIVNASLWTIPVEIFCYALIAFLGVLFKNTKTILLFCILILISIHILIDAHANYWLNAKNLPYTDILRLVVYFFLGALTYFFKSIFVYSGSNHTKFIFLLLLLLSFSNPYYFSFIILPIIIINLAFFKFTKTDKLASIGNFSYGFYLFAFPIQQSINFLLNNNNFFANFFLSLLITAFFSTLSWYLVEKPFIKIKNKIA